MTYSNDDLNPIYYKYAKKALQLISEDPMFKMFLYSCSYPENLNKIVEIMKKDDIIFNGFNENLEAENTIYGDYSKKPYFNILLEDKAGFEPEKDWLDIYHYLLKRKLDGIREIYDVELKRHQEYFGELWGADPACWHEEDLSNNRGGVKCKHCNGWFCF